jgi:cell division initiation protein
MIDLTPIEIRKKKGDFPRSVRGYNVTEVDLFLDLVADRLEEVVRSSREVEARINQLEEQLDIYRKRERALTDALVSAETLREESRRQSERESEILRQRAEADAEKIRAAALLAVEKEQEILRRIRARRVQALNSFRLFLERELAELSVIVDSTTKELA